MGRVSVHLGRSVCRLTMCDVKSISVYTKSKVPVHSKWCIESGLSEDVKESLDLLRVV